jgi:type II secretory pathway component PulJ
MNLPRDNSWRRAGLRDRGVSLIECLVYVGVFFLVSELAFSVFYRTLENSRTVSRTADDIAAALRTGERWRQDVRGATAPLRVENGEDGQLLTIPGKAGAVRYRVNGDALSRQTDDAAGWIPLMTGIKSSRMEPDPRVRITAWRWELELKPHRKSPHVLPLFTFEAVPAPGATP